MNLRVDLGEYMHAQRQPKMEKGKTQRWFIFNNSSGMCLGEIKWYAQWRQYTFIPVTEHISVFNSKCLEEITRFLKVRNMAHMSFKKMKGAA